MMNLALITAGIQPAPRKTARGRIVHFTPPIKRGPRPLDESLPAAIRPGTRAAIIWRVLPDACDDPLTTREIARELRRPPTVIAPALTAMYDRALIERYGDPSGYGYTRAEVEGEAC